MNALSYNYLSLWLGSFTESSLGLRQTFRTCIFRNIENATVCVLMLLASLQKCQSEFNSQAIDLITVMPGRMLQHVCTTIVLPESVSSLQAVCWFKYAACVVCIFCHVADASHIIILSTSLQRWLALGSQCILYAPLLRRILGKGSSKSC